MVANQASNAARTLGLDAANWRDITQFSSFAMIGPRASDGVPVAARFGGLRQFRRSQMSNSKLPPVHSGGLFRACVKPCRTDLKCGFPRRPALMCRRIIHGMMTRDAISAELLELEALLQDDRVNDDDRHALHAHSRRFATSWKPTLGIRHRRPSIASIIGRAKSSRF